MKNSVVLVILCLISFALPFAISLPAESIEISPVGYTVSGRVTDYTTGSGIAGALVTIGNYSAMSSAGGYYSIAGVPAGTYGGVFATHKDYVFVALSVCIDITGDAVINITGRPVAAISTYTISGRVTNQSNGAGVAGVTVSNGRSSAVTDANGFYRIAGVAAGTYGMSASKAGWKFIVPAWCINVPPDAVFNFSGSADITVLPQRIGKVSERTYRRLDSADRQFLGGFSR